MNNAKSPSTTTVERLFELISGGKRTPIEFVLEGIDGWNRQVRRLVDPPPQVD
jgi:hypothetical protein